MFTIKHDPTKLFAALQREEKRLTRKHSIFVRQDASRLQKRIQHEIDISGIGSAQNSRSTGTLRSINRGGIHKRKLAKGEYEVYMKPDYAAHLEYGTSRGIRPYRYFDSAVKKHIRAHNTYMPYGPGSRGN